MTDDDLAYLSIAELSTEFRARRLSPVDVTEALVRRACSLEDRIHAYVTVTFESAMADARQAEARFRKAEPLGPLDGVPVALKDLIETAGVPTRGQSKAFVNHVPTRDATVVERLRGAGAILLGKLSLYELGGGQAGLVDEPPPARNPWSPGRVPGGSSSGSAAALSAGLCVASVGTDTGGSVRAPAAYCGVVGLKPTYGLVSRAGCFPLAPSLDHVGPMARTCADVSVVLAAISGRDIRDPTSVDPFPKPARPIEGLRIGVPRAFVESSPVLDRATLELYNDALEQLSALGVTIRDIDFPSLESEFAVYTVIVTVEAYREYANVVRGRSTLLRPSLHNRMLTGAVFTPAEYALAQRGRTMLVDKLRSVMDDVDVLFLPTAPHVAPTWEEELTTPDWKRPSFRRLFNITGQPALSVPGGLSPEGLPVGLQFVGHWFDEATVLAVGRSFEEVRPMRNLRPPLTTPVSTEVITGTSS